MRKAKLSLPVKREVALRHGGIPGESTTAECVYCGSPGNIEWLRRLDGRPHSIVIFWNLEIDHVVPEALGGTSDPDNLVLACRSCNRRKNFRRSAAEMVCR